MSVSVSPVSGSPEGQATIVRLPVFVRVDNWDWQPDEPFTQCDGSLCVTATATPEQIVVDPGEDGSNTISCDGPGVLYDESGPAWEEQARRPEACTHIYRQRTGVGDRPPAWTGTVTVVWEVTRACLASGLAGLFQTTNTWTQSRSGATEKGRRRGEDYRRAWDLVYRSEALVNAVKRRIGPLSTD